MEKQVLEKFGEAKPRETERQGSEILGQVKQKQIREARPRETWRSKTNGF